MAAPPDVAGYTDLVEIGRGGFARVFRAHQVRFNRAVALKVLNLADPDERTRDRFERECRAMGELSWHPHVVAVYDSGITDDGHLWLAMEHIERGSLADAAALSEPPVLDWNVVVTAGIEVCGALGAAHAAGTLHRDLKPENVLVGPFGEARLGDFGIAAVDGGRRTTTGVASFTVAHVAPEVLRGQRQDERTDVYGLASTLHTLLAGAPPFDGGPDEPVAAVMMRIIDTAPPRLGDPVPDELADLIVAGLAKEPGDRPQSAAELGAALQEVQRNQGAQVTPLRLTAAPAPGRATDARPDDAETVTVAPPPPTPPPPTPPATDETGDPATADPDATITVGLGEAAGTTGPAVDPPGAPAGAGPDANATITVAGTPPPPDPGDPLPIPTEAPSTTLADPPTLPPEPTTPRGAPAAADTDDRRSAGGKRRLVLVAAAIVATVVVIGGAVLVLGGGGDGDGAQAGTFQTAAIIDTPTAVAVNDDGVWVTDAGDTLVYKLDPQTGDEVTRTGLNAFGTAVALTEDGAGWIISDDGFDLIRIDLATNEDTNDLEIGDGQESVSAAGTDVWVARADGDSGKIVRFDAIDLSITAEIDVGTAPNQVAATADAVWVTSTSDDTLTRIDPSTDEVADVIDLGVEPSAVAAVDGAVWVLSASAKSLTRADPSTGEIVTTIELGDDTAPGAMAAAGDDVWITDGGRNLVLLVDAEIDEVVDEIRVGDEPFGIAATESDVWVTNAGDGTLTHIDPPAFG